MIWARSALLHVFPPVFHLIYRAAYREQIVAAYKGHGGALKLWTAAVGYVAMSLTWKHTAGSSGAAKTYAVTWVRPSLLLLLLLLRPLLLPLLMSVLSSPPPPPPSTPWPSPPLL